jgi:putative transcriptional regulator
MTTQPETQEKPYYHHSVCDAMIWSYLQGDVDPGVALLVATHADLCPDMRKRLKEINACAAVALESVAPEPMTCSAQAFFEQKCCGRKMVDKVAAPAISDVPQSLQKFVGTNFDAIDWRAAPLGIQQKTLKVKGSKAIVRLLKISAGTRVPAHRHCHDEFTVVLKGVLQDGDEHYGVGDVSVHFANADHTHAPFVAVDCICLHVLAGAKGFQGLLSKILNPFRAVARSEAV